MAEEGKILRFEITPTNWVVYSVFNPESKSWSALVPARWTEMDFWPSPMSAGLNYALTVFEGMKAFRNRAGEISIFRLKNHAQRFNRSLSGLLMPEFPLVKFSDAIKFLVKANSGFVPEYRQGSLYIRPIAYGNDRLGFGFNPDISYTAVFWCSPTGNYYTEGLRAISIWVARNIVRAMPGGVGCCKASGNYEISRKAQFAAKKEGCQDALFLDGRTQKYIEEFGGANIFVIKNHVVYTPRLRDTILAGITRQSVITLARSELKLEVLEKDINLRLLTSADEVFACGTAASITPVGKVIDRGREYIIGLGKSGEITKKLYKLLTDIQYDDAEDKFNWLTKLKI